MSAPRQRGRIETPSEIWFLVGAAFVIAVGFGLVSPVLPSYARSFDVGVTAATVVVSVFAAFRLVFAPVGGALTSRLGERPVYLAGLLIVAASSLATAFAQTYWQLLVFRGLGGIGSTMFTISAMALIVRLAPPAVRGRVSSLYGSSFLVGNMIGPVVGGLLAGWGLRAPFIGYAAALVVAAAVVAVGLGGARLRPRDAAQERPPARFRDVAGDRSYLAVLASGLAHGWVNMGVRMAVVPLLAVAVRDRPWVAGAVLAVAAVGTAATLQVSGRLTDRVGRRGPILAGLAIVALSTGPMGFVVSGGLSDDVALGLLLVLSLLSGVGAGLIAPASQAAVGDIVGSDRAGGQVFAGFQMAMDLGTILGPVAIGMIVDAWGFQAGFLASAGVCLVGALPWLWAPDTLRRIEADPRLATPAGRLSRERA